MTHYRTVAAVAAAALPALPAGVSDGVFTIKSTLVAVDSTRADATVVGRAL